MEKIKESCHGVHSELNALSLSFGILNIIYRTIWQLKKRGTLFVLKHILKKLKIIRKKEKNRGKLREINDYCKENNDILDLQPGDIVEVKSENEIRETLDSSNHYKGLLFMPEMWNYCGKKFKVYKKLDKIIIESTSELRKIKNTVLLKGVICDGSEHYGCDRSCFHFWREAWLKKIEKNKDIGLKFH